ncbi:hypothetical protein M409DRAFT_16488 [Zasmidium cellare ATCC 36951]|uniref:Uncharacterized protein n=1 Tax=Zasmidium cellare ATCC 36951 TaxID=1080233 RepID=A0A6A6D7K6_ZASCE|nr:uncharacterized protein M409DRAFT_16488 [Zasmidium cellare ATCC 36951]KAF2174222.1 hypothetical protein M409DRAFT_16488 [Zasmidium cellare ATCC 36951]
MEPTEDAVDGAEPGNDQPAPCSLPKDQSKAEESEPTMHTPHGNSEADPNAPPVPLNDRSTRDPEHATEQEASGIKTSDADGENLREDAAESLGLGKRLKLLRKNLAALEKVLGPEATTDAEDDHSSVSSEPGDRGTKQLKSIPEYNLTSLESYKERHEKDSFSFGKKHHTIDVVMAAGWPPPKGSDNIETANEDRSNTEHSARFIQINSQALCAVLHETCRSGDESQTSSPPSTPLIMLAPFKPLCSHIKKLKIRYEKLKIRYEKLKTKYQGMKWEKAGLQSVESHAPEALEHPPDAPEREVSSETTTNHKDEAKWRSSAYAVSWLGYKGFLRFKANLHWLQWAESTVGERLDTFSHNIDQIHTIERTIEESPVVAMKLGAGSYSYEFLFTDADNAQSELDELSSALVYLVKREKALKLARNAEAPSGSETVNLEASAATEDVDRLMDSAKSQCVTGENKLQKVTQKVHWNALGIAEWQMLDIKYDDSADVKSELTDDDRASDGYKAFEDLQCLIRFFDKYLQSAEEALSSKRVQSIRYGDLCSFFRPGDNVYIPDDHHKVWRVVSVTGGRPNLEHLLSEQFSPSGQSTSKTSDSSKRPKQDSKEDSTEKASEPRKKTASESQKWSTLWLDAYYIDFDGKKLDTVRRQFSIAFFPGAREIRSLKAYPLQWLRHANPPGSEKILKDIESTGKRFVDYCLSKRDSEKLLYYDGRTNVYSPSGVELQERVSDLYATNSRRVRSEDVSSNVVVDFDKTFQYNPSWKPDFSRLGIMEYDFWERAVPSEMSPTTKSFVEDHCRWDGDLEESERDEYFKDDIWVQRHDDETSSGADRLEENDFELLPAKVFGYVLRTRSWACLDIHADRLKRVRESSTAWDELQLPDGHRRTLQSLVKRHFDSKEAALNSERSNDFDIIQGKGRGLIVLLHGAPGLGKAPESIAALYKKPLLPITCGNLGLDALAVESALSENFELAQAWDCIVLLDEADVFLAERDDSDLERNALVSVFLRTLENYSGILFLTTNRIGAFDEAFRSRIHSALFYKELDQEKTVELWRSNLNRLVRQKEELKQPFKLDDSDTETIIQYASQIWEVYTNFERPPWNGREIRNAFQTAVALAEYKAHEENERKNEKVETRNQPDALPTLTWENFRSVILASQDFKMYIQQTHGETDYSRQARKKARKDTSVHSEHDNFRRAYQRQRAQAFSIALANVRPGTIFLPELHPQSAPRRENIFAGTAPGPGHLAKAPTYNDMIASSHQPQPHEYPTTANNRSMTASGSYPTQPGMYPQQAQQHQSGWQQQGPSPAFAQSTAAVGTYSASTQMYGGTAIPQQQSANFAPPPSFPGFAQSAAPVTPQHGHYQYTQQTQGPSPLGQHSAHPSANGFRDSNQQQAPGTPSPAPINHTVSQAAM